MRTIDKEDFDDFFKKFDFWQAVDAAILLSKMDLNNQLNERICRIMFMDSVFNGDGFITYDTSEHGIFIGGNKYLDKSVTFR